MGQYYSVRTRGCDKVRINFTLYCADVSLSYDEYTVYQGGAYVREDELAIRYFNDHVDFFSSHLQAAPQKVVAQVNAEKITLAEFNEEYDRVEAETINPPPKEIFLEDLVRYEIGAQEAEKQKIDQDPIVKKEIRKLLYKWLLEKNLGKKVEAIEISESEMKSFYSKNPEIRTSHILIQVKPGASKADREIARKRAEQIFKEVRSSNKKFADLVSLYTDDIQTKSSGGDLGWQTRVTTLPEFYEAALKTSTGKIAPLVETKFGFHIIQVTDRRNYARANKRKIRFGVFEEKKKKIFDAYFASLKPKYKVQVDKSALK